MIGRAPQNSNGKLISCREKGCSMAVLLVSENSRHKDTSSIFGSYKANAIAYT